VIEIRRAADRATSGQDGIRSWYCFSAGADYDPGNVAFGPVIGVDEHLLDPGAGFAEHPHRGVQILTWVLDGQLRHRDDAGHRIVGPGTVMVQLTGSGIRHVEQNASNRTQVRFVQTALLGDDDTARCWVAAPPVRTTAGRFSVVTSLAWLPGPLVHAFVGAGSFRVNGEQLDAGDSVRARDELLVVDGAGQLLVVQAGDEQEATAVRT
jgi:redox-sensitive bicupin YhaK (pirin superfamily)